MWRVTWFGVCRTPEAPGAALHHAQKPAFTDEKPKSQGKSVMVTAADDLSSPSAPDPDRHDRCVGKGLWCASSARFCHETNVSRRFAGK